jgi:hypothetical protein
VNKKPLDKETYARVHWSLSHAQRQGLDPVEYLHLQGLLASPAARKEDRLITLKYVHNQIASWRPAEVLRRKFLPNRQTTPADMYSCILEFIEEMIEMAKEE